MRMGVLNQEAAVSSLQVFRNEWPLLVRVQATEALISRADSLAWELGLRGYDAVHLASALLWQESMGQPVTLATFDRTLWEAARQRGIKPFTEGIES